jgi:outer membrane murein-binding lipoprotein Lpp
MKCLTSSVKVVFLAAVVAAIGLGGCTKKPNQEELTKLEEARSAAESAEKKLAQLREERIALESQLQGKEGELQANEQERDELKAKMNK